MTNRQLTKDEVFRKACDLANVEPTVRQASKYLRRVGRAYDENIRAYKEVKEEEAA